jgi:hypothetical protein
MLYSTSIHKLNVLSVPQTLLTIYNLLINNYRDEKSTYA